MSKKEVKAKRDRVLRDARSMAAIDREIVLSQGGNALTLWRSGGVRGGAHTDRRKEANRRACREW